MLKYKDSIKEIYGGERNTSNQRMELTACIKALEHIRKKDIPIEIYSDSAYLVNCINEGWYQRWVLRDWKTSTKKSVANRDLWERLIEFLTKYRIQFYKVEGHSGIDLNARADKLAKKGMQETSSTKTKIPHSSNKSIPE